MTQLFSDKHNSDASEVRASGKRAICQLLPSALLGDTWRSQGEQRLTRHPERLHQYDSAPPTMIDNEPTRIMSAQEIAEALAC